VKSSSFLQLVTEQEEGFAMLFKNTRFKNECILKKNVFRDKMPRNNLIENITLNYQI
jgi:hypothetical protein